MTTPDSVDTDVRLGILNWMVANATAPTVAEMATTVGIPEADVAAAYDRLAAGRVIVLRPGTRDVLMAAPLSAVPTRYAVRLEDDGRVYGNCAWDALGVLAMVGTDGEVHATCPDCEAPLRLAVHDGVLEPSDAVVHFVLPPARWWEDIVFT